MIPNVKSKAGFLAGIWLVGVIALVTLAAQTPTQIHPAPPPVERPVNLVVLADGFTAAQEDDFNDAAANFFTYGLLADGDFAPHKDLISVKTIFKPVTTAQQSQFKFVLGTGVTNCSISWDDSTGPGSTAALIETAAAPANPTRVVVIGNYNYNFGCSTDTWTYVALGAVGEQVLQHELGHLLGGLKDEYVLTEFLNTTFPGTWDTVNCSTLTTPQWSGASGLPATPPLTNQAGCALYGAGIVHPYDDCRMGVHGNAFCPVCNLEMKKTWDYYGNPAVWNPTLAARTVPTALRVSTAGFALQPPPAQPAQPAQNRQLRLLASVNRTTGAVTVVTATDVTGAAVPRLRRVGPYVFEAREGNNTVALEVISGDPFGTHGYRGGGAQHTRVPDEAPRQVDAANIVVTIPGVSRDEITKGTRAIGVVFYRLRPEVKDPVIQREAWEKLKAGKLAEQIARITPDQLREFFSPTRKDNPRQGAPAKPPARDDRAPAKKQ